MWQIRRHAPIPWLSRLITPVVPQAAGSLGKARKSSHGDNRRFPGVTMNYLTPPRPILPPRPVTTVQPRPEGAAILPQGGIPVGRTCGRPPLCPGRSLRRSSRPGRSCSQSQPLATAAAGCAARRFVPNAAPSPLAVPPAAAPRPPAPAVQRSTPVSVSTPIRSGDGRYRIEAYAPRGGRWAR